MRRGFCIQRIDDDIIKKKKYELGNAKPCGLCTSYYQSISAR